MTPTDKPASKGGEKRARMEAELAEQKAAFERTTISIDLQHLRTGLRSYNVHPKAWALYLDEVCGPAVPLPDDEPWDFSRRLESFSNPNDPHMVTTYSFRGEGFVALCGPDNVWHPSPSLTVERIAREPDSVPGAWRWPRPGQWRRHLMFVNVSAHGHDVWAERCLKHGCGISFDHDGATVYLEVTAHEAPQQAEPEQYREEYEKAQEHGGEGVPWGYAKESLDHLRRIREETLDGMKQEAEASGVETEPERARLDLSGVVVIADPDDPRSTRRTVHIAGDHIGYVWLLSSGEVDFPLGGGRMILLAAKTWEECYALVWKHGGKVLKDPSRRGHSGPTERDATQAEIDAHGYHWPGSPLPTWAPQPEPNAQATGPDGVPGGEPGAGWTALDVDAVLDGAGPSEERIEESAKVYSEDKWSRNAFNRGAISVQKRTISDIRKRLEGVAVRAPGVLTDARIGEEAKHEYIQGNVRKWHLAFAAGMRKARDILTGEGE